MGKRGLRGREIGAKRFVSARGEEMFAVGVGGRVVLNQNGVKENPITEKANPLNGVEDGNYGKRVTLLYHSRGP